ncbi:MAG: heavy metal translocating P-type ATPase, partial [Burkholderiales bacterium]
MDSARLVSSERVDLPIEGMTCAACASRIENSLNRLPGVEATVNLATEHAAVRFDPARALPKDLVAAVEKAGYRVPAIHIELALKGMSCAACAARIEKSLNKLAGVDATVNFATERAQIRLQSAAASVDALIATVRSAGYDAHRISAATREAEKVHHAEHYRRELRTFWISVVLTLPLVAQMGAMFAGHSTELLPRWLQFLLATPVQFWIGRRFYVGAWHALRGGSANMDVLIALGTSMAYVFSATVTLLGLAGQHVYFEASAAIITLVLMGKLLEARAKGRTSAAIEQLLKLQPKRATIERNGSMQEIDVASIVAGDRVLVGAGERVAVDGIVERGHSSIDESM